MGQHARAVAAYSGKKDKKDSILWSTEDAVPLRRHVYIFLVKVEPET